MRGNRVDPGELCRAVESYLCRKNDGHLIRIVGPAFELVCGWAAAGIPLRVVERGIDRRHLRYHARGPKRHPLRIEYCEADVLDLFDEWKRAVGLSTAAGVMEEPPGAPRVDEARTEGRPGVARSRRSLAAHLDDLAARLSAWDAPPGAAVLEIVRAAGAGELPRGGEIAIDGVVVAVTLGVALVFGLALGLVPVAGLAAASLQSVLRQETRGGTGGRGVQMFRNGLVVGQIGLACVLLSSALLLLASFQRILQIDTGFRTDNLLTAQVALPEARYPSGDDRRAFAERILQRIRAIPGVTAAGITSSIPFGDDRNNSVIRAVGYEERPGESLVSPSLITIDGGYLDTLGVPLVEGRFFDERDTADAMRAIIIDERLARRFWPDRSALGGRMYGDIELRDDTVVFTVVGVVAEHTLYGLVDQPEQVGAYFFPHTQLPLARPTFAIRTAGDPRSLVSAVRATVAGVDAELPLFFVQTMDELVGARLTSRRTPMLLALGFAGAALFLSALGIYGVLAYRVAQRRREFGVRLALGSSAAGLFRLVLSEGALLVGVGLALGVAGTLAARRALAAQLYGIEAGDPLVAAAVVAVLTVVALAACALPARRATRVDPVRALSAD